MEFYRGDTREPEIIKRDGFDIWGEAKGNIMRAGGIVAWLQFNVYRNSQFKKGEDIADWVRVSKDRGRPTISTAKNAGCGGYSSDYVYKIRIDNLVEAEMNNALMGIGRGNHWTGVPISFFLDGLTLSLAASTTIALDLKLATEEVVFFTKIDPANIVEWKHGTKQPEFQLMSGVTAAAPEGPKKMQNIGAFLQPQDSGGSKGVAGPPKKLVLPGAFSVGSSSPEPTSVGGGGAPKKLTRVWPPPPQ